MIFGLYDFSNIPAPVDPGGATGLPAESQWTEWITIPRLASETTGDAQRVKSLTPFNGRLYVGYGDWERNTGPCDVISVGPDKTVQTHLSDVPTEALEKYVVGDGALFAPSIDPSWYFGPGGLTTNYGGTWRTIDIRPDMVHTLGFAASPDGAWWVCGSALSAANNQIAYGVVYRSSDKGATWVERLRSNDAGSVIRFYDLAVDGVYTYVTGAKDDQGTLDIRRTKDGGATWEVSSTFPSNGRQAPPVFPPLELSLRSAVQMDGVWYAGGDGGKIYRLIEKT